MLIRYSQTSCGVIRWLRGETGQKLNDTFDELIWREDVQQKRRISKLLQICFWMSWIGIKLQLSRWLQIWTLQPVSFSHADIWTCVSVKLVWRERLFHLPSSLLFYRKVLWVLLQVQRWRNIHCPFRLHTLYPPWWSITESGANRLFTSVGLMGLYLGFESWFIAAYLTPASCCVLAEDR